MNKNVTSCTGFFARSMLILLSSFFILVSCSTERRVYKVGILSALDYFIETKDGFIEKMTELGYEEGDEIIYLLRRTNFEHEKEIEYLREFIREKVDLVLTFPSEVSLTAKNVIKGSGIPIVFANTNIEGLNLIDSISVPGNNITGVRFPGPDITIKRLEIMMELLPGANTFLVCYQENYPIVESQLEALHLKADQENINIIELGAKDEQDLSEKLNAMPENISRNINAVLLIAEPLVANERGFPIIGKYAEKFGIPIGGALMRTEEFRSFYSVATDNKSVGRQAALIAHKILNGIQAGTIPVVSAENYIVFDLVAAKHYGIEINEGLLKQADELIH